MSSYFSGQLFCTWRHANFTRTLPRTNTISPPRTTSRVQSCDADIKACVNAVYKRRMRVLENIDQNVEDIYRKEILTALNWRTTSCSELSEATIYKYWTHCFNSATKEIEELHLVQNVIEKSVQPVGWLDIDDLRNPIDEDDVHEQVSDDCLTMAIVESINPAAELDDIEFRASYRHLPWLFKF